MLALHVIMGAGYGVPFTWHESSDKPWPKHKLSFKSSVLGLLKHLLGIVIIPKVLWKLPFRKLQTMNEVYNEFGQYLRDLLERPKTLNEEDLSQNLISALSKSAEMEKREVGSVGLTEDQIIGNAFIFLVAGHETTYHPHNTNIPNIFSAHTMWYALLMLALHPPVQETLLSEIHQVLGDRNPTYDDFPHLVYALCIVFETLRLFPPVVGTPKIASDDHLLLGKYPIPKGMAVIFDIVHVHRDPKFWGPNSNAFDPSRFDGRIPQKTQNINPSEVGNEKIRVPVKGAFLPFAEGQRSCLGRLSSALRVMIREKVCSGRVGG